MREAPAPRDPPARAAAPSWRVRVARAMVAVLVVVLFGVQMGLLAGKRPSRLGPTDGSLQPVRAHLLNAVSSTATTDEHRIAPLDPGGDPQAGFERLGAVVASMPGARIVARQPHYLYAEFESRWLGFVDDVEFLLDPRAGVIHVRSASRLGRRDFGVNRARVEAIRAKLGR
jgi:uncharacterized protein (DUF1499 family)